jgi:hypothetical protein
MSHRDTPELRDGQKLTAQTAREAPSKTPRTDAEEIDLSESIKVELQSTGRRRVVEKYVTAKFARQLEIELSQERERGRWIPVSKELPDEGVIVLTWDGENRSIEEYSPEEGWGLRKLVNSFDHASEKYLDVTHWQPLPSAPK